MKFTVEIDCAADEFRPAYSSVDGRAVGDVLRRVALYLESLEHIGLGNPRVISDGRGLAIGKWELVDSTGHVV